MPVQKPYHYLSYTLLLFLIALMPVVPVSLLSLLITLFGVKWVLLLLKKPPNYLMTSVWMLLSLAFMQINGLLSFSVNGFIHLAVLGVFLKFLEAQKKTDMLSLLYLLLFVGVTPLLLNQELLQTGWVFLVFLFTLNNLIAIGQRSERDSRFYFLQTLRFSFMQLVICLPIMLILFLIFPRLPPLWVMPDPANNAKTGLSNRMSPGSIAQLATSNERAFKVNFLNDTGDLITEINLQPVMNDLYWRVLTMDRYDGVTWYQSAVKKEQLHPDETDYSDAQYYRLYMDKTTAGWLAVLNRPTRRLGVGQWRSDATVRLQANELTGKKNRFVYESKTSYQAYQENRIEPIEYQPLLQLPDAINPKTRELAESLRYLQSSVAVSDKKFVNNVLNYFARGFIYTLQPPLLTASDQIDQFLFESKQGFCGHYASAMAVIARMQGIPTRIVSGYLGGTFNPHGGFWEIQQKEAHAWVELYYDDQWHRVDPTAVVSDIRVSRGMDSFIAPTQNLMEKVLTTALFTNLQQRLQAVSHFWDQKVLGYNESVQISLTNRIVQGWKKWQQWFYSVVVITAVAIFSLKPQWIRRLFFQFYQQMPVHQRLMTQFDRILFDRLNENSHTLNDIHKMSISERKALAKQGNATYRTLCSRFLTKYQHWRFHPEINGATTGKGREAVIRLKQILHSLSALKD